MELEPLLAPNPNAMTTFKLIPEPRQVARGVRVFPQINRAGGAALGVEEIRDEQHLPGRAQMVIKDVTPSDCWAQELWLDSSIQRIALIKNETTVEAGGHAHGDPAHELVQRCGERSIWRLRVRMPRATRSFESYGLHQARWNRGSCLIQIVPFDGYLVAARHPFRDDRHARNRGNAGKEVVSVEPSDRADRPCGCDVRAERTARVRSQPLVRGDEAEAAARRQCAERLLKEESVEIEPTPGHAEPSAQLSFQLDGQLRGADIRWVGDDASRGRPAVGQRIEEEVATGDVVGIAVRRWLPAMPLDGTDERGSSPATGQRVDVDSEDPFCDQLAQVWRFGPMRQMLHDGFEQRAVPAGRVEPGAGSFARVLAQTIDKKPGDTNGRVNGADRRSGRRRGRNEHSTQIDGVGGGSRSEQHRRAARSDAARRAVAAHRRAAPGDEGADLPAAVAQQRSGSHALQRRAIDPDRHPAPLHRNRARDVA